MRSFGFMADISGEIRELEAPEEAEKKENKNIIKNQGKICCQTDKILDPKKF